MTDVPGLSITWASWEWDLDLTNGGAWEGDSDAEVVVASDCRSRKLTKWRPPRHGT